MNRVKHILGGLACVAFLSVATSARSLDTRVAYDVFLGPTGSLTPAGQITFQLVGGGSDEFCRYLYLWRDDASQQHVAHGFVLEARPLDSADCRTLSRENITSFIQLDSRGSPTGFDSSHERAPLSMLLLGESALPGSELSGLFQLTTSPNVEAITLVPAP